MRFADPVDAGSATAEKERAELVARAQRDQAARPINRSGLCRDCDDPINPARLAADPCVARCVPCQEDAEARARHRRRV